MAQKINELHVQFVHVITVNIHACISTCTHVHIEVLYLY